MSQQVYNKKFLKTGFTLLEVLLGLALLLLVVGGTVTISRTSLDLSKQSNDSRQKFIEKAKFNSVFRFHFSQLESTSILKTNLTLDGDAYPLVILNTQSFMINQKPPIIPNTTAIYHDSELEKIFIETFFIPQIPPKKKKAKGDSLSSITQNTIENRKNKEQNKFTDAEKISSFALTKNIASLNIEFYDNEKEEWIDEWEQDKTPPLVKFIISYANKNTDNNEEIDELIFPTPSLYQTSSL